jgi:putative oxidoreductase
MLDLIKFNAWLGVGLDQLRSPLLLAARYWVSWQFLKSGWLKATEWDSTLELFRSEYHVPLLSPALAAVAGTSGELVFGTLVLLGLCTRIAAPGLFAVNLMAVVSYWHVLGQEGFEAALAQHVLWGCLLLGITAFGAGAISVDRWLVTRMAPRLAPG